MKKTLILLLVILFLGVFLRWHNLSPFKIYPDSYQSLLVAKNIQDYHSVVGYLGTEGMVYPYFFSWSRPTYPFLIYLLNHVTNSLVLSAQIVTMTASMLTIVCTFFFIRFIFKETNYALAGTLLLATSFQHTVWNGFMMTEPIGVFLMLAFLWSFFRSMQEKTKWFAQKDLLTGLILGATVLTRYEYAVIIIPVTVFIFLTGKEPFIRLSNIFITSSFMIALCFFTLFPVSSTLAIILRQISDLLIKISIAIVLTGISMYFIKKNWGGFSKYSNKGLLVAFCLFPFLCFLLPPLFLFRNFMIHDPLLSCMAIIGSCYLIKEKQYISTAYFVVFSCVLLGFIYQHVNTTMDRYITHLLPFLLIPASFGLIKILKEKKRIGISLVAILTVIQIYHSFQGLRYMHESSWYKISYEEKAANTVSKYLPQDTLLIAAVPEPYFLQTNAATQSITKDHPYLIFSDLPQNQKIIIIQDMPMRAYFPKFSLWLTKNMSDKKKKTFWIHEKYLIGEEVQRETSPIILYETTSKELQMKLLKEK